MNKVLFTVLIVLCCLSTQAKLDLLFSNTRGYYNNSFPLIIEADDPNATIRYTTNGRTPTFNVGSTYNGPINVNTTKVVKAFAYSATDTTKVIGHTYIFINDVLNQPDNTSGFPYVTGFSNTIKNDGTYGALLDDALQAIPVMCLSLHLPDYDHIYNNKGVSKQAYIEYFEPSTTESYGRPTGVSTYGNTSFSATNANKKNYRLRFKDEFGASKFNYKIFGDEAASDFDVIDLRCGSQESFDRGGVQNIHEKILKDWQIQTSNYGVHGKFTHLYVNGIYWGVYTATERPNDSFGESYFGGKKDDYNTIKSTCCNSDATATDGTVTSYNFMVSQAGNYPAIEQYLDIDHFIDWVIICNYGPHGDWTPWNTYAFDNPTANVPYRFFMWDPEPSFKSDWYYTNYIVDTRFFEDIWQPLKSNADFRMRFADHTQCNCIEADGPINPNNAATYYDEVFQQNKLAYLAEAARWADKNLYNEFLNYRDDILNTNWFFDRSNSMIQEYKNNNIYPNIDAVTFNQYGGILNNGSTISLNNPNNSGSIRYTIDRSDPRAPGGSLGATAQTYNGNITLPNGVYEVKARIKHNPEDSIFFNPVINSIDTVSGRNFEFIELKNTGTQAIYLEDVHFNKGITFQFAENAIVQPGGFVVVAEDAFWFQQKYGFVPDAIYIGKLENSGENIWLLDPFDNIIDTLRYDDILPWDTIPDNGKYSLALIDATIDNSLAVSWGSQAIYTTPKAENVFCDGSLTFTLTLANVSCNAANDGFITGNALGGNAPYTYQWDNGSNNNTISNLAPGNYTLTLKDNYGCTFINSYQITEPVALSVTVNTTDETYYLTNDGTATINVLGGVFPYTYSWSNGDTNSSITNLSPGNYSVNVVDATGCPFTESITIQAIECNTLTATISKTDQTYYQTNNGTATVNALGSVAPYTYSWSNGGTNSSINNLSPDSYSVNILSATGCSLSESISIETVDCSVLTASVTKTDQTYYQINDGTAIVNVLGGVAPYTYSWSNGANSASLNNLVPGNYSIDVIDAIGCPVSETFAIDPIFCNALSVDVSVTNETCQGQGDGLLIIRNISNGTAPYSMLWSTGITGTVANNLATGNYQLTVTDVNGCPFQNSYQIGSDIDIQASFNISNVSSANLNDGLIEAFPSGGSTPYTFQWSTGTSTQNLSSIGEGVYSVTITDVNGCSRFFDQLIIDNDCVASIVQQNNPAILSQVYHVAQFIKSNGMVNVSEQVGFKAGNYIELTNDFEVIQGAEFDAMIEGCQ